MAVRRVNWSLKLIHGAIHHLVMRARCRDREGAIDWELPRSQLHRGRHWHHMKLGLRLGRGQTATPPIVSREGMNVRSRIPNVGIVSLDKMNLNSDQRDRAMVWNTCSIVRAVSLPQECVSCSDRIFSWADLLPDDSGARSIQRSVQNRTAGADLLDSSAAASALETSER